MMWAVGFLLRIRLVVISGIGIRIVSAVTAAMRETLHGELSL
mgnify:CR=1 FL=1